MTILYTCFEFMFSELEIPLLVCVSTNYNTESLTMAPLIPNIIKFLSIMPSGYEKYKFETFGQTSL